MNTQKVLDYFHIDYVTNHPEVSNKCFGVSCPFCGDTGKHCGIFIDSGNYSCWKCGKKGGLYKLLKQIKHISWDEFKTVSGVREQKETVKGTLDSIFDRKLLRIEDNPIEFDSYTKSQPIMEGEKDVVKFLRYRSIVFRELKTMGVRNCKHGKFSQRLLFPVYHPLHIAPDRSLQGFVGRDYTGIAERKYLFPAGFKAHEHLYSTWGMIPTVERKIIIVEGVMDAIAMGDRGNAIALFGKNMSFTQLAKLTILAEHFTKLEVMLDSDAFPNARMMARDLAPFFSVSIIQLGKGDPESMRDKVYSKSRKITNF